jgi:phosphate transport system protein
MWKQLFTIFKKSSLLDQAFIDSYDMLDITQSMFIEAKKSLREKDVNLLETEIYSKDLQVNKYEREVRRKVINHITVAGADEINSALVIVSIIIDIERIGDYTKNIVDLAKNHPAKLTGGVFDKDLVKIEKAVENTFSRVIKQLKTSDVEDAEKLINEYQWVNRICDQHVIDYIKEVDKSVSSGDAVALALYFRYIKRINSHLRNIATSLVNPFDYLGFTHRYEK